MGNLYRKIKVWWRKCCCTCELLWIRVVKVQQVITQRKQIAEITPCRLSGNIHVALGLSNVVELSLRFWLVFTFITQLLFNHLAVGWLNKGVEKTIKKNIMCQPQRLDARYGYHPYMSLGPNLIAYSSLAWRSYQNWIIPSLYKLLLFCPETCISLPWFDTITLNISWLQTVTGINLPPCPNGTSDLCVPPSWLLAGTQPKAFSAIAVWLYCSAEAWSV